MCHTNVCMYINVINDTFLITDDIDKFIMNLIIKIYALISWRQPLTTSEEKRGL